MPAVCVSNGFAESFTLLLLVVVVVNAIALMVGALKPGEAFRNSVVGIVLLLVLFALIGTLIGLWGSLSIREKICVAVIGAALVWRLVPRRRRSPRRGKAEQ